VDQLSTSGRLCQTIFRHLNSCRSKLKIETLLSPAELPALAQRDLSRTACVVFDILRATSTFVTALHHGAEKIIPASEISEAVALKQLFPNALLAGERDGVRIRAAQSGGMDFDFGNSPREFTPEKIRGRTIISTTTNGTRALRACADAACVLAGSFLNLNTTADFLRQKKFAEVLLVCAGTGDGVADEDVLAAKLILEKLQPATGNQQLSNTDLTAAIGSSQNGRRLLANPDLRADVAFCAQQDVFNLVAALDASGALRKL